MPLIDAVLTANRYSQHPVDALFSREIGPAHDRWLGSLARQARRNTDPALKADEMRSKLADCGQRLLSKVVAEDYP